MYAMLRGLRKQGRSRKRRSVVVGVTPIFYIWVILGHYYLLSQTYLSFLPPLLHLSVQDVGDAKPRHTAGQEHSCGGCGQSWKEGMPGWGILQGWWSHTCGQETNCSSLWGSSLFTPLDHCSGEWFSLDVPSSDPRFVPCAMPWMCDEVLYLVWTIFTLIVKQVESN